MKLREIIKYNGAVLLTGMFFSFVTATGCGSLLAGPRPSFGLFLAVLALMLLGGGGGLFAAGKYRPRASTRQPDNFLLTLPVTGLPVMFMATDPSGVLPLLSAPIWGVSVGIWLGMLLRCNPDPRTGGYPSLALGGCCGGGLAIMVMGGIIARDEIFAVLTLAVVLVPVIGVSARSPSRRRRAVALIWGSAVGLTVLIAAFKWHQTSQPLPAAKVTVSKTPRLDALNNIDTTSLLPIILQNNSPRLRILVSEPPSSDLGAKLARLPLVAQAIRAPSSTLYRFNHLPEEYSRLRRKLTDLGFDRYCRDTTGVQPGFDMIFVITENPLSEADNRFQTREFYQLAADFLAPGGVVVTAVATLDQAAVIVGTLQKIFPYQLLFPGRNAEEIFVVASAAPLSDDYNELDRRACRRFEPLGFCRGMLAMLQSPASFAALQEKFRRLPTDRVNSDLYPFYLARFTSIRWPVHLRQILPWLACGIYLLLRFLLSRKQERRVAFNSFENGFYCGGIILIAMFVEQAINGQLYLYLGGIGAIFLIGTVCGLSFHPERWLTRQLLLLASLLLPFSLLWYNHIIYQEFSLPVLWADMFLTGWFGGAAVTIAAAGMGRNNYRDYLFWLVSGLPAGLAVCWLALACGQNLTGAVLLLAASRLPLLFQPANIRPIPANDTLL
ncbi:MAG: hypothetical protein PHQ27_02085 [Victivallales bacterium]|nr:hypothetical protein [Victivallales bacterium]